MFDEQQTMLLTIKITFSLHLNAYILFQKEPRVCVLTFVLELDTQRCTNV